MLKKLLLGGLSLGRAGSGAVMGGWQTMLVAGLVGVVVGGWLMSGIKNATIATERLAHVTAMKEVSDTAAKTLAERVAEVGRLNMAVSAMDAKYQQELTDAKAEHESLRAAVAAGATRLSVRTTRRASGRGSVPSPAGAACVDNGGASRAELHPADAANLLAVTGDADTQRARLIALQAYVREIIQSKRNSR